jgi:hypothetical protein
VREIFICYEAGETISRIADAILAMQERQGTMLPALRQQLAACEKGVESTLNAVYIYDDKPVLTHSFKGGKHHARRCGESFQFGFGLGSRCRPPYRICPSGAEKPAFLKTALQNVCRAALFYVLPGRVFRFRFPIFCALYFSKYHVFRSNFQPCVPFFTAIETPAFHNCGICTSVGAQRNAPVENKAIRAFPL